MSQLSNQWIDVFAAGNHGETKGGVFTEADLDDIVRNFDPSHHEPPAVIGHPKDDAPAYAWVDGVRRDGKTLQVKFRDADAGFEDAVKSRRFPKRSVSLYKTAKGWMLRHVGFLGAQPPQVKGLADIKFGDEDKQSISIDFEESGMAEVNEQSIVDKIVARFAEAFGGKKTTETASFTEAQAKQIAEAAVTAAVTPLQTELASLKATFAESQRSAATSDVKTRAANAIAGLKAKGKWVPAFDKLGIPVLFEELAKETVTVEFGEADKDGKREKKSALDIFVNFMDQHAKIVPTSEVYSGRRPGTLAEMPKGVNPGRMTVDANSIQFDDAVKAKMRANDKLSYFDAAVEVERESPELSKPGGVAAGAA